MLPVPLPRRADRPPAAVQFQLTAVIAPGNESAIVMAPVTLDGLALENTIV